VTDLWSIAFLVSVLAAAVPAGTALLYAAMGETFAERSGILNLGVEGMMLMGALSGFAIMNWSGNAFIGAGGAILAGGALALIHAVLTISLNANQVVSGLALTLFGTGLSAYLGRDLVGKRAADRFTSLDVPLLADIPHVGRILFQQNLLVYASYFFVPLCWWYVYRTRQGLNLRALGERPEAADTLGLNVDFLRYCYVVLGGALAGLGGVVFSLGTNPGWIEGMTAGAGWIAVALVIFSGWNPLRIAAGAWLFGGVQASVPRLQSVGVDISPFFLDMLPYLFTIIVLVLSMRESTRRRMGAPAALGRPFVRGQRA
jgi:general nucleoside transport system permease protein